MNEIKIKEFHVVLLVMTWFIFGFFVAQYIDGTYEKRVENNIIMEKNNLIVEEKNNESIKSV